MPLNLAGDDTFVLFRRRHICVLIKILLTSFSKERGVNPCVTEMKLNLTGRQWLHVTFLIPAFCQAQFWVLCKLSFSNRTETHTNGGKDFAVIMFLSIGKWGLASLFPARTLWFLHRDPPSPHLRLLLLLVELNPPALCMFRVSWQCCSPWPQLLVQEYTRGPTEAQEMHQDVPGIL